MVSSSAWLGQTREDGWSCEGYLDQGGGTIYVRIWEKDAGTPFQTITLEDPGNALCSGETHWQDINFDGAEDVLVSLGGGRGGGRFYAALLWDASAGEYREEATFADIYQPVPDEEHKLIWDGYDTAGRLSVSAWEFQNGAFVQTHQLIEEYQNAADWAEGTRYTEYARPRDGEGLELVREMEVLGADAPWCLEAYVSDAPVWEGWKWCPLARFRQTG